MMRIEVSPTISMLANLGRAQPSLPSTREADTHFTKKGPSLVRRLVRNVGVFLTALGATMTLAPVAAHAQGALAEAPAVSLDLLPALAGGYHRLDSAAVGRPFHIFVSLPQSYEVQSSAEYPVVFVLDGDSLFPVIAPTHLFLNIDYGVPEAIVVGIAYGSFDPAVNKRGYDFSAPGPDADASQGGAPAFHAFLEDELIPLIEHEYRVDSSKRVLFGQSRGGGMVLYSAFAEPDVFWGRIAVNPTFTPGRDMLFSRPADAARDDLGLVVTSGSNDMPPLRQAALEWFSAWSGADNLPWRLHMITIDGGTHASYSPSSYRAAMLWLFGMDD